MENQNVRLVVVFIIGVIVGVIAYAVVDNARDERNNAVADTFSATSSASVIQGDNGLTVKNQTAGNQVKIEQVIFSKPGWVAIHDEVNGQPGRILGAQLFDMGKTSGTVDLLRNTVAGMSYLAVLHTDDGNYKNFNHLTDTILMGENQMPIMIKFNTQP